MLGSSSIDRAAPTVHGENQIFQFAQIDHLSAAYDSKTASGIHLYYIHRACGNDSAIGFRRRTRRYPGARTTKHAPAWSATSARRQSDLPRSIKVHALFDDCLHCEDRFRKLRNALSPAYGSFGSLNTNQRDVPLIALVVRLRILQRERLDRLNPAHWIGPSCVFQRNVIFRGSQKSAVNDVGDSCNSHGIVRH